MPLGPLALVPRLVEKPWGARHLADLGRDLPDGALVGESWDVADLDPAQTAVDDPVTRVAAGPQAGATLRSSSPRTARSCSGRAAPTAGGRFPLLVKHLDAGQHLSVQVHPPAAVLDGLPGAHLKTESWIVVQADEGAELMLGVVDGVTPEDLEAALGTPAVVPLLRRVPARVGDVHHVPAGLLHALGAGVVVCEPQTPSDTTYRLYDWTEEYGRAPRDLHAAEAMLCLRAGWDLNVDVPGPVQGDGAPRRHPALPDQPHHRRAGRRRSRCRRGTGPRVVVVVEGSLSHPDLPAPLGPAGVCLLPAAWSGSCRPRRARPGWTSTWSERGRPRRRARAAGRAPAARSGRVARPAGRRAHADRMPLVADDRIVRTGTVAVVVAIVRLGPARHGRGPVAHRRGRRAGRAARRRGQPARGAGPPGARLRPGARHADAGAGRGRRRPAAAPRPRARRPARPERPLRRRLRGAGAAEPARLPRRPAGRVRAVPRAQRRPLRGRRGRGRRGAGPGPGLDRPAGLGGRARRRGRRRPAAGLAGGGRRGGRGRPAAGPGAVAARHAGPGRRRARRARRGRAAWSRRCGGTGAPRSSRSSSWP